jgi:hypothetical protein
MNMTTRNLLKAHEKFVNNKLHLNQEISVSQSEESLRVEDTSSMDERAAAPTYVSTMNIASLSKTERKKVLQNQ